MSVAAVNLILEKGTDFEAEFNIQTSDASPLILSNYTGVAKIRKYPTSPISYNFVVAIDPIDPIIKITMSKINTMKLESGRNYFDIFITETISGLTSKAIEGSIIVYDSISV